MALGRERFELASLGDLVELLIEGWRIDRLHYADRSGAAGPPAAFLDLVRGPGERRGVYVPDDGRALSHRALVALFREAPGIWKHRSPDAIPLAEDAATSPEEWGAVPEPFPEALAFGPATLRGVVPSRPGPVRRRPRHRPHRPGAPRRRVPGSGSCAGPRTPRPVAA